jgi:undecaprenyl-diphosphatase
MKKILILPVLLLPVICSALSHGTDITLLKAIDLHRFQSLDHLFMLVTNTAKPIVVSAVIVLFIMGLVKSNDKMKLTAIQMVGSLIVTTIIVLTLKHIIDRPRPYITYPSIWHVAADNDGSFPSGHTSVCFAVATILSLNYRKRYIIIPFFVWAALVAYSRLYLGLHYPSDVAAGAVIGIIASWVVYKIFCRSGEKLLAYPFVRKMINKIERK